MTDLRIIRIPLNPSGTKIITIEYRGEDLRNAEVKLNQRKVIILPDRATLRRGFEVPITKSEKIKLRSKGGLILITRGDQTTEIKEVVEVLHDPRRAFLGVMDLLGVVYLVFAALIFLLLPASGRPAIPQPGTWVIQNRDNLALLPAGIGMLFILLGILQARGYQQVKWIGAAIDLFVCGLFAYEVARLQMGWFYFLLPVLLLSPLLLLRDKKSRPV